MFSVRLCLFGLVWATVATAGQIPTEPDAMFDAFCAVCHGEDGRGQVENPAIDSEPMDFTDCAVATPEPDADWQLVITHGGLAAGLSSEMPSYGDALTDGQIQALIGYIRGFCAEPGWPIGTLNFPRPIFTEKAFPENEFLLLPEFSDGADGVMVARGDLGVEFPLEQVPIIQRRIVREARQIGRPVIVATQMLESMIDNAAPTRAETGDVATAVYQGVDAVMLSAETAVGRHPATAVAIMDRIIQATEAAPDYRDSLRQFMGDREKELVIDIVARAAQSLAFAVKAKALALRTGSARRLAQFSKHRGRYFILYGSSDTVRLRRAQLLWGVHPIHISNIDEDDWPLTLMKAADLEGAIAYAAWKGGADTAWEMGIRRG